MSDTLDIAVEWRGVCALTLFLFSLMESFRSIISVFVVPVLLFSCSVSVVLFMLLQCYVVYYNVTYAPTVLLPLLLCFICSYSVICLL